MDTNATTDDDVKAIKKLGEEFFAGVNAEDLDRRMATMDPDVVIMPPGRPSIVGKEKLTTLCVGLERPEGRVHFAGEHISVCPYWMQGALQSGLRAAKEVHEANLVGG